METGLLWLIHFLMTFISTILLALVLTGMVVVSAIRYLRDEWKLYKERKDNENQPKR